MKLTKLPRIFGTFAIIACLGVLGWSHDAPNPSMGTAAGTFDIDAGQFSAVLQDEGGVARYRILGSVFHGTNPQGTFRGELYMISNDILMRIGLVAGLYVEGPNETATLNANLMSDTGHLLGVFAGSMKTHYLYGPTPPVEVPLLRGNWALK